MEFSQEFYENGIFAGFNDDSAFKYFDDEIVVELHQIVMVEYDYEARLIQVIRNIKSYQYQQARLDFQRTMIADDLSNLRDNVKSLLKGLIATSAMASIYEIRNAPVAWHRYGSKSDTCDLQDHHKIVYREFRKVETLEDLKRFNIYFHDYILDLVFATAEIFIKRLRYTIEYFQNDKQFEEACATGLMNIEKFKKDLAEAKSFKPEPPVIANTDNKAGQKNQASQLVNQIKARPIGGWLWAIMFMLIVSGLATLVTLVQSLLMLIQNDYLSNFFVSDKLTKQWIIIYLFLTISSVVILILIPITLNYFFKRKKYFKDMFIGLLGYSFFAEIIRVGMMLKYYSMAGEHLTSLDNNLLKIGVVLMITGLYLNKGKRPLQTFKF